MSTPKIAIAGAGPAGLVLASILHRNNIPVTIFEGEASSNARTQGGTLDLHPPTGQAALAAAGLMGEFEKHARPEGEDFILADKTGHKYFERVGGEAIGRPEIDRVLLRQILLDSLPDGTIKWGHHLKRAEQKDGKTTLHFANSSEGPFDLVVGADGAWSKIRPLLTTFKPFYSSISMFDFRIRDIDNRYPKLGQLVGNGSYFAFGEEERQCMLIQRNGDGSVRIYAGGKKPEEWVQEQGLDKKSPNEMREETLKDYGTWNDDLRELIKVCDDDIAVRPLYMMPVGARWAHVAGLTLVGDAAHLMTPFAGEGVNVALTDGMKLAQSIIGNVDNLAEATKKYEVEMFGYAAKVTMKTWSNLQDRFEPGGIDKFMEMINGRIAQMKEAKAKAQVEQEAQKEVQKEEKINE